MMRRMAAVQVQTQPFRRGAANENPAVSIGRDGTQFLLNSFGKEKLHYGVLTKG
jgi:hypothetical protein